MSNPVEDAVRAAHICFTRGQQMMDEAQQSGPWSGDYAAALEQFETAVSILSAAVENAPQDLLLLEMLCRAYAGIVNVRGTREMSLFPDRWLGAGGDIDEKLRAARASNKDPEGIMAALERALTIVDRMRSLDPGAPEWIRRSLCLRTELRDWSNAPRPDLESSEADLADLREMARIGGIFAVRVDYDRIQTVLVDLQRLRQQHGNEEGAILALKEAAKATRDSVLASSEEYNRQRAHQLFELLGTEYLRRGDLKQAKNAFETSIQDRCQWLEREKNQRAERLAIARLYLRTSAISRTLDECDKAVILRERGLKWLQTQAESQLETTRTERIRFGDEDVAALFTQYGAAFRAEGLYDDALEAYQSALRALGPKPREEDTAVQEDCLSNIERLKHR